MEITFPLADQFDEAAFVQNPVGPSSRSCCRVLNSGSCGSGSIVGKRDGKTLLITNAHVAGSTIGRVVQCEFPFANNLKVNGRVIMAAYSDRILMDWAIVEIDQDIQLPVVKLSIEAPGQNLYTAGYPRCQGPRFQELRTTQITHNGTVWRGLPASIGGQSGSAIHSTGDHLQRVLLTWLWSNECAGQTTRSIWFQYRNQAAVGFERPDGLIELGDKAEWLENGFFAEANITQLPIWAHLDDPTNPPPSGDLKKIVLTGLDAISKEISNLARAVGDYQPGTGGGSGTTPTPTTPDTDENGTFGL